MLYSTLIDYFKAVGNAVPEIKQHYHGDAEEIMNFQTTKLDYPVLWTETPDFRLNGDMDSKVLVYTGNISLLDQTQSRDKSTIQEKLKATQEIALKLLFQLEKDAENNTHYYSMTSTNLVAIDPSMVDGAVGWRLDYVITTFPDFTAYCEGYQEINI